MSNNHEEHGEIVDARVDGDRIVYTAEHSDGGELQGTLPRRIKPHTVLSDGAMENLAEQIVGMSVEWPTK